MVLAEMLNVIVWNNPMHQVGYIVQAFYQRLEAGRFLTVCYCIDALEELQCCTVVPINCIIGALYND